jgi:hypothetical protein
MKKFTFIFITMIISLLSISLYSQTARVQVIHNAADAAVEFVDVYVDGVLAIEEFAFRSATPYIDLPAGVEVEIALAPPATSYDDAIAFFNPTLTSGETYIVVANGLVNDVDYSPFVAFDFHVYPMAREMALESGNTDILVFHGSTDAPIVDVYEAAVLEATFIDDMDYAEFRGYFELPTDNYVIEVRDETGTVTVASYDAPLAALELDGQTITVLASGFLNPANNNDGPAFGLYVALAEGGELIPLPLSTARVQVIHNAADAAVEFVDVYVNGILAIEEFAFRSATPYIDLPAGVEVEIALAPPATSYDDAIAFFNPTLTSGETYIVVANGLVNDVDYSPFVAFDFHVYPMAREMALESGNTDILVFHGSTDAPIVDVYEAAVLEATFIDDMDYAEFRGYFELPTDNYVIEVRDETGTVTVASYDAPLAALELDGQTITVLASGFLNPANNNDGPAFGLYVALAEGGELIPLELHVPTGIETYFEELKDQVSVYPNPASEIIYIKLGELSESNAVIQVFNGLGQMVYSETVQNLDNEHMINTSNFKSGMYYININFGSEIINSSIQIVK